MSLRRALVVDDSRVARSMVTDVLEESGWAVDEAETAEEATLRIEGSIYDLVVLDFVLPDEDGLACLTKWRAMGVRTPILALTSAESDEVLRELILAGAHDVVRKGGLTSKKLLKAIEATTGPPGFPQDELPGPAPRAPEAPDEVHEAIEFPPGRRALVVDDTRLVRQRVRELLQDAGWLVDEAPNAEEAIERAELGYDLLVVDYLLPDFDGVALLNELRAMGIDTPAIALTAHGSEKVAMEFFDAGAAACLTKEGLDRGRLLRAARDALAAHALGRR